MLRCRWVHIGGDVMTCRDVYGAQDVSRAPGIVSWGHRGSVSGHWTSMSGLETCLESFWVSHCQWVHVGAVGDVMMCRGVFVGLEPLALSIMGGVVLT
jgi:hypothetical protein